VADRALANPQASAGFEWPQQMRERVVRLRCIDVANIEISSARLGWMGRYRHRSTYAAEVRHLLVVESERQVLTRIEPSGLRIELVRPNFEYCKTLVEINTLDQSRVVRK